MTPSAVTPSALTPSALTPAALALRDTAARRIGPLAALEVGPCAPVGRPVVLVPGFTGSKEDFALLLPLLAAQGRRAVAIDQPGQFESPGSDDPSAYAVDALADDLLAALRVIGAPVHLVGHSFGGLVARTAVLRDPAVAASLTLLDSGPAAIRGSRVAGVQLLRPVLSDGGLPAVWAVLERVGAQTDPQAFAARDPEVVDFLRRRFLAQHPVGLRAMGEALLAEPDRVDLLAATGVPVLVAYGEHDDAWSPALQAAMATRLGARRTVIAAAVHSPAVEQPSETAAALLAFWTAVEDAAPTRMAGSPA